MSHPTPGPTLPDAGPTLATTSWHSYPKVWNLGHPKIDDLFDGPVIVEEKVDGSQFSFGVFGGELKCRSKGSQLILEEPEKMFQTAVDWVEDHADLLHPEWTYRAEYLQKPKHNVLAYERVPANNLVIFDVNCGYERYLGTSDKVDEACRIGLESAPLLSVGTFSSADEIRELLETDSHLGGTKIEGVVIKNYAKFGEDGKCLLGKYVSEAFKERHSSEWKKANPTGADRIQSIGQALRTEARWEKAVQHLRERGEITDSPKDIGALLKELSSDTKTEEEEAIKAELFKHAWSNISRIICRGFPEWYKDKLLEKQFENGET